MRKINQFWDDRRGSTAMIFALSLVPLVLIGGLAVDYSNASRLKTSLQNDLDAAVLSSAIYAADRINAGAAPNTGQMSTQVNKELSTRVASYKPTIRPTLSVNYSYSDNVINLTATAQADIKTYFGGIVGQNTVTIGATSAYSKNSVRYANISLVLDVSPSMAIGATTADITALQNLTLQQTGTACAFACHDAEGGPRSNYQIARSGAVTLRIDVVKQAAQQLASVMTSQQQTAGQYSMGLYTMGSRLSTVVPTTTNLATIAGAIANVDFDTMTTVIPTLTGAVYANLASGNSLTRYADSDFPTALRALNQTIGANGDGSLPSRPAQYVFLVTDGVQDTAVLYNTGVSTTYNFPNIPNFASGNDAGKLIRPLDPSLCTPFKDRGIEVGVVYVTYVANPTDPTGDYQWLVQNNAPPDQIVAALKTCASGDLFYQANDNAGISDGLITLFKKIALTARLTK